MDRREFALQFGRICGIALAALGMTLLVLQFVLSTPPNPPEPHTQTPKIEHSEHKTSVPLPGIIGAGSLAVGIGLFVTGRRKDEPPKKYAVK